MSKASGKADSGAVLSWRSPLQKPLFTKAAQELVCHIFRGGNEVQPYLPA